MVHYAACRLHFTGQRPEQHAVLDLIYKCLHVPFTDLCRLCVVCSHQPVTDTAAKYTTDTRQQFMHNKHRAVTASANSEDSWKRFCLSRTRLRCLVTPAFRRRIYILLLTYLLTSEHSIGLQSNVTCGTEIHNINYQLPNTVDFSSLWSFVLKLKTTNKSVRVFMLFFLAISLTCQFYHGNSLE